MWILFFRFIVLNYFRRPKKDKIYVDVAPLSQKCSARTRASGVHYTDVALCMPDLYVHETIKGKKTRLGQITQRNTRMIKSVRLQLAVIVWDNIGNFSWSDICGFYLVVSNHWHCTKKCMFCGKWRYHSKCLFETFCVACWTKHTNNSYIFRIDLYFIKESIWYSLSKTNLLSK